MKVKNKLIIIFSILLIILLCLSNVKASTINYMGKQFPEFPEGFEDSKYSAIFYDRELEHYVLFLSDTEIFLKCEENVYSGDAYLVCLQPLVYYHWNPKNDTNWVENSFPSDTNLIYSYIVYSLSGYSGAHRECIYSKTDIYDVDHDQVFFHATPLLPTTTMQRVIGVNIWQIVPQILITILALLVFSVGLRKGLKTLSKLLRQS